MDLCLGVFRQEGTGKAQRARTELGISKRAVSWACVEEGARVNEDMKPE